MIEEFLQATRQTLLERLASPLLSSFVLAWCVWNWKFLVILISSATVSQTFALAELHAFPNASAIALKGILYPLISALVYVFVYPYPARFVYEFTLKRQRELNETKKRIADETPLTKEESRRLRVQYVEYERKQKRLIEELHEEVARLNAALEEQKPTPQMIPLTAEDRMYDHLEPTQIDVLRLMESFGGEASESQIINSAKSSKTQIDYDIGELEQRELITRNYSMAHDANMIKLTHQGRKVLLELAKTAA